MTCAENVRTWLIIIAFSLFEALWLAIVFGKVSLFDDVDDGFELSTMCCTADGLKLLVEDLFDTS